MRRHLTDIQITLLGELTAAAAHIDASLYLVGGIVRDILLGRGNEPKDIDIAVEAGDPDAIVALTAALEIQGWQGTVHARFKTVTVEKNGQEIDLITARSESYPYSGALPEVAQGTLEQDLQRRDFSINAMAYPLTASTLQIDELDSERIIDPTGGRSALVDHELVVLHEQSFLDDPTRMLRAARYCGRLGFTMDVDSMRQLRQAVRDDALETVSADRIHHELELIFAEPETSDILAMLASWRLLAPALVGRHSMVWVNGMEMVDVLSCFAWARTQVGITSDQEFALLYSMIEAGDRKAVFQRFAVGEAMRRQADTIARAVQQIGDAAEHDIAAIVVELDPEVLEAVVCRFHDNQQIRGHLVQIQGNLAAYIPRLRGDDLRGMGVSDGPEMGRILKHIRTAVAEGTVSDSRTEQQFAASLITQ